MQVALNLLHADPRNPNVCSAEGLEKLKRNIQRTNLCPALIVRPHPEFDGEFMIIDGHHRKLVLEELGWTDVNCEVWDISDQEAKIALATLNRLRGTDDPKKRAELIASLVEWVPALDLAELLPESAAEINDLLALVNLDLEQMEERLKEQIQRETESLPVALTFLVSVEDARVIEEALERFKNPDRGISLGRLCRFVLENCANEDAA